MIGMILLAVLAVSIFFGITDSFFGKMGVANWVAFLVVLAFAVAAVFPPLVTGANVSFSYAGFFLPLLLGVVTLFALGANSSLLRAVVGALSVAGIVIAARIALPPVAGYRAAVPSILIAGFAGGITAFVIGQSRLATLSATLCGTVLGDFVAAMLFRFVTGAPGVVLQLGQNGIFDSAVLAAIVGGVSVEIVQRVRQALSHRTAAYVPQGAAVNIEAAEDMPISEKNERFSHETEGDDVYKDYFDDDAE